MKTTLKNWFKIASAKIRDDTSMAFNRPITSILSLCLVAGIVLTPASFAQTSEKTTPAAFADAAQTMPVERTITDIKGRSMDGTITGKTDTSVSYLRKDGQNFEIMIDTLSKGDQDFIAGLISPDPKAVKKPKVLIISDNGINESDAKTIEWLKNYGFEIHMGYLDDRKKDLSWPESLGEWTLERQRKLREEKLASSRWKTIIVEPLTRMDLYDVVWFFDFQMCSKEERGIEQSFLEMAAHLSDTKCITVIPREKRYAEIKYVTKDHAYEEAPRIKSDETKNYVQVRKNFIFYSEEGEPNSNKSLTEDEVFAEIGNALGVLLRK